MTQNSQRERETEQVVFQATKEQIHEERRMDVLSALDREFDEAHRDQRAVLTLQKRIYQRQRRIAFYTDQLGGTALLARHYGAEAALPYAPEYTLR